MANFVVQWFNGDGNVSAFRIRHGTVSFQQRYVRTEKFVREREAKKALVGRKICDTFALSRMP